MTIHTMIVDVPNGGELSRRDRVVVQRRVAREALDESARLGEFAHASWPQDEHGVPVFENGVYWSISHKPLWAAAVVADRPVGIDIESLTPRRVEFFDQVADRAEWRLVGRRDWDMFFRLWTAKEATLKANRVGIGEMGACRIVAVHDDRRADLAYRGVLWRVEHFYHAEHTAAVALVGCEVEWHVIQHGDCKRRGH